MKMKNELKKNVKNTDIIVHLSTEITLSSFMLDTKDSAFEFYTSSCSRSSPDSSNVQQFVQIPRKTMKYEYPLLMV